MAIFVTGDTHGELSMSRFSGKKWIIGKSLTKQDFLIIAGDFGSIFYPVQTGTEKWWLAWLENKPWTTLFVDGNHENHETLNLLPREVRYGGIVGKVSDSVYHLRRGEIYEICGKKILAFGGAQSIDREHRIDGVSWWKEEIPNHRDMENCLDNLEKHQYSVDIIIAHQCPLTMARIMGCKRGFDMREADPTCKMLEHIVTTCTFSDYYCGHWHLNEDMGKYHFLYTNIVAI